MEFSSFRGQMAHSQSYQTKGDVPLASLPLYLIHSPLNNTWKDSCMYTTIQSCMNYEPRKE